MCSHIWSINSPKRIHQDFENAYVGIMEHLGVTYNMQCIFSSKGYFKIKITPLDANLCLMEEGECVELKVLVEKAKDWLKHVCFNDNTIIQINMDVARFMVRTKSSMVLNEAFNVHVNDEVFMLKLVEDSHGPLRIRMNKDQNKKVDSNSSSDRSSGS
ncbi:unnamed protein product [Lathyrus oleraceus]